MLESVDFGWLVGFKHQSIPTERRNPTEQNVSDDTSCPDVNLEAVSVKGRHVTKLHTSEEEGEEPVNVHFLRGSPRLSNDLGCNISRCSTHGMKRPVDNCSQAKVTELQRFTAVLMLINL